MESVQSWVSEHKLTTVGGLWASGIGASLIAYSRARSPMKPSLRLIHARMHAQALTLAVLSGAAAYHYYEKRSSDIAMANNNEPNITKSLMEENTTTSSSVSHQWELLSPF
ncbi:uncharacterized protein LOC107496957 [Arachis duranensis]|uniref:HIG1 domain-containing protein n=2 Tax=Arachis TaxID=3817 RepID=A0A445C518_ARAHY|nr:uncharacterized protein LOC107496957 [Arachis duranensis]XP_025609082.1 uncharacterized protein LOC112702313 [Arachis hypogaea]QHO27204.1 uncharacterized protein DS421_7g205990 [Arachis hypogaea]RYR46004.1 hypothetical protein Ahy_A07g031774 [Arachis hypogaea]